MLRSGHTRMDSGERVESVLVFLCYRRSDGAWYADWLYDLLHGAEYSDGAGTIHRIRVYYDRAAPGVADWKAIHLPSLASAQALLVVVTPGVAKDFSSRGSPDWVYEEIRWWIGERRGVAPIVIDTTGEGVRWLPQPIQRRWPDVNRIDLRRDEVESAIQSGDLTLANRIRDRLVATVRELSERTTFAAHERSERQQRWLTFTTWAGIVLAVVTVALAALSWIASRSASRERDAKTAALARLLGSRADAAARDGGAALLPAIYLAAASIQTEPTTASRSLLARLLALSLEPDRAFRSAGTAFAFQPGGNHLASLDGTAVSLLDWSTRREVRRLELGDAVSAITWSADGAFIAAGTAKGDVGIWNAGTGVSVGRLDCGHRVVALSVRAGGDAVISTCSDGVHFPPAAYLWRRAPTWPERRPSRLADPYAYGWAFTSDGQSIAAHNGRQIKVFAYPAAPKVLATIDARQSIDAVALARRDSGRFAVATEDGTIAIWHLNAERPVLETRLPRSTALQFSTDGSRLAVGGTDAVVRVLDSRSGEVLAQAVQPDIVQSLAVDETGHWMVATFEPRGTTPLGPRLWRVPVPSGSSPMSDSRPLPFQRPYLLAALRDRVIVSDPRETAPVLTFARGELDPAKVVGIAPREGLAVVMPENNSKTGRVEAWKVGQELPQKLWETSIGYSTPSISPDGHYLAIASVVLPGFSGQQPLRYRVLQLATGDERHRWTKANLPGCVRTWFTPDARQLLACNTRWRDESATSSVPDGEDLLAVDLETGRRTRLTLPTAHEIAALRFDPHGRQFAIADGLGTLHDGRFRRTTPDGRLSLLRWPDRSVVTTFQHAGSLRDVDFSPDGTAVVVVDTQGVTVHTIATHEDVFRIEAPTARYAAFSADGDQVVIVDQTGVRRFYWRVADLLARACAVLPRNLTPDEWNLRAPEVPYRQLCPAPPD